MPNQPAYPRLAACTHQIEQADLTVALCSGFLLFSPGDRQARCNVCRAWCGAHVANYLSDLHSPTVAFTGERMTLMQGPIEALQ